MKNGKKRTAALGVLLVCTIALIILSMRAPSSWGEKTNALIFLGAFCGTLGLVCFACWAIAKGQRGKARRREILPVDLKQPF